MTRPRAFCGIAIAFVTLLATNHAFAIDKRLIGAWTTSPTDCASTFQRRGSVVSFREPKDQFSTTFIITNDRVIAAGGVCKIAKNSQKGDVVTLDLNCVNDIGYINMSKTVTVTGDGKLNYGFPGEPALDVAYEKCPL